MRHSPRSNCVQVFSAVQASCSADDRILNTLGASVLRKFAAPDVAPHDFQLACNRMAMLPDLRSPLVRPPSPTGVRDRWFACGSPAVGLSRFRLSPAIGLSCFRLAQAKLVCLRDTLADVAHCFQRRGAAHQAAGNNVSSSATPEMSGGSDKDAGRDGADSERGALPATDAGAGWRSLLPCALSPATSSPLCGAATPPDVADGPPPRPRGPLSADDMLPLTILLAGTARVPALASHLRFMELFFILHPSPRWPGNSDLLKGHLGYVLATFECAVAHLLFLGARSRESPLPRGGPAGAPLPGQQSHRRRWSFGLPGSTGASPHASSPPPARGAEPPRRPRCSSRRSQPSVGGRAFLTTAVFEHLECRRAACPGVVGEARHAMRPVGSDAFRRGLRGLAAPAAEARHAAAPPPILLRFRTANIPTDAACRFQNVGAARIATVGGRRAIIGRQEEELGGEPTCTGVARRRRA